MGNATFQSIDRNMESIAVTITNAMRTQGSGLNMSLPYEPIPIFAKGIVMQTTEIPAWKSSVLPLLLTGNQVGAVASAIDIDKTKANTNNLVVSLAHLERGWEFVVESHGEKKRK
ncbi:uncharacterized protein J4E78_009690 [Alternaria triticimaculans]|uniref:uncharacterized protein n=1 Tax=Alternaria triticimaculans TaxID=297637 RepID=UPI0020C1B9F6|nr:uncharacterized protein J4E78_009690 [Alternaria triticimaculans]KAI4644106.1 hypothetical protein J4E78_009690 [Alternaria triticimaculans]